MKLFDDSENTDNSVGLPKHSGSIPDRIYHKLRVTPSNLAVFKLLTDNSSQGMKPQLKQVLQIYNREIHPTRAPPSPRPGP